MKNKNRKTKKANKATTHHTVTKTITKQNNEPKRTKKPKSKKQH